MLIHTLMFLKTRLKHKILKRIYELSLKVCSITETKNKSTKSSRLWVSHQIWSSDAVHFTSPNGSDSVGRNGKRPGVTVDDVINLKLTNVLNFHYANLINMEVPQIPSPILPKWLRQTNLVRIKKANIHFLPKHIQKPSKALGSSFGDWKGRADVCIGSTSI